MARFDVHANPSPPERQHTPYLLDVQNDYISGLDTRVVIPLRHESVFGPRPRNLNPRLVFNDQALVLDTAAIGAVPLQALRKPVGRLNHASAEIMAALDTLFGSF